MKERKSLIKTLIFIIFVFVLLIGGAIIYNKFFFSKTYVETEELMRDAAISYLKANKNKLPKVINNSTTVKSDTLIKQGYMKDLSKYLKDGKSCSGEVIVTNINGNYRYAPYLDCGKNYETLSFMEYINKNVKVVKNEEGLNQVNDTLVYKGDNVDNYIKLGGKMYRIVKFVDGKAVIIYTDVAIKTLWDDRYNIITEKNTGINDYEVSRIKAYLDSLYEKTGEDRLLGSRSRLLMVSHDLSIGKRSITDNDKSGKLENALKLSNQYIGLLPVSDYLNASLDENCTGLLEDNASKSCSNYNYLNRYKYNWWTVTANSKNTFRAFVVNKDEDMVISTNANSYAHVRPVFHISSDAIYVSGKGTKKNPFVIK